ncbi:MAG: hypothetical protein K2O06_15540 [Acetatifactor sp.]|nr:hypothetical protein [Acetatifactor sp.]
MNPELFESTLNQAMANHNDEPFFEMAMIAYEDKLNISVNQETKRLSIAYFKVYDHQKYSAAGRVARLHFKDSGMEYHSDSRGKKIWEISGSDSRRIVKLMQSPSDDHDGYTNWQVACYQWNYHNGLVKSFKDYFAGKYDHMYDNDDRLKEAYVPSTQEMPETWIYNPENNKKGGKSMSKLNKDELMNSKLFESTLNQVIADYNDEPFFEMAGRLPKDKSGVCSLVVAVGGNERNIAHFHVFRSEEDLRAWRNGACLYFTENKYYDHSNNAETLTRDELKELVRILKSKLKDLNTTSWKYLVSLWNYNNDRYPISYDTPMPDYDYKTITRYKEKDTSDADK